MVGELPRSISVNGTDYEIRTDFRDIINIITAFNDPELEDEEKVYACLFILYIDFDEIPKGDYEAAYRAALAFIDYGIGDNEKHHPRTIDWEQDEKILFPDINKVAGYETRTAEYVHWWTFVGFFLAVKDGLSSTVINLRSKKAKGKKLEKHEREFWNANKGICVLKEKLTEEEQAEKDRLNALLG